MAFIFDEMIVKDRGDRIFQRKKPYISPEYEMRDAYLIIKAKIGYKHIEDIYIDDVQKNIDLGSLNGINEMIIRKAENLQYINRILKRDKKGLYTLSDFLRGRIGEIYGEMGVMKLLSGYVSSGMENGDDIDNCSTSVVHTIKSGKYVLKKKINAMNHSNYLLLYNEKQLIQRGEFDFAFEIYYTFKGENIKVLVIGETKTGNLSLNKEILANNLVILENFPYNYIVYALVIPKEAYYSKIGDNGMSNQLKSIYKYIVNGANKRKKVHSRKIRFMPVIFDVENKRASSFFKNLGEMIGVKMINLLKENKIRLLMNVHLGNSYNTSSDEIFYALEVPLSALREDARRMSKKRLEEKYGKRIFVIVKDMQ